MITFPSRISELIKRVEAGSPVTQAQVDRIATLQALDFAKFGEDFAIEVMQREDTQTEEFRREAAG